MDLLTQLNERTAGLQAGLGEFTTWITTDPDGQRIGLGLGFSAALFVLLLGGKSLKTLSSRCKRWPAIALLCLAGFYTAVLTLELDPQGWAAAAAVSVACFLLLAVTVGKTKPPTDPNGKPQPA